MVINNCTFGATQMIFEAVKVPVKNITPCTSDSESTVQFVYKYTSSLILHVGSECVSNKQGLIEDKGAEFCTYHCVYLYKNTTRCSWLKVFIDP